MPAKKPGKKHPKRRSPRCHSCEQTIRVPKGWSTGAAVRRHYWAKHRDVMEAGARGAAR